MKITIAADFSDQQTPEEALSSLAANLTDSIRWLDPEHAVIELRALTADISVAEYLQNFPSEGDQPEPRFSGGRDSRGLRNK